MFVFVCVFDVFRRKVLGFYCLGLFGFCLFRCLGSYRLGFYSFFLFRCLVV